MTILKLAITHIIRKKHLSMLLILSIALSAMLLIGFQKIKHSAKASFSQSIAGTDLIVGPRTGNIQLLLYTIFHKGNPISSISYKNMKDIEALPEVAWVVPLSLGDSHRGFPVLGTSAAYFKHYKFANKQALRFQHGKSFSTSHDVVIGSHVAKTFQYKLGDTIYIAHGAITTAASLHKNHPFKISGILKPTQTPVDKTVHIPLEAMSVLHAAESAKIKTPDHINAFLLGLHSKFSIFSIQKRITEWPNEALLAIIPGLTLAQLWQTISSVDMAFWIIGILVAIIACIGLLSALFISLQQRQKELAVLRIMGARPIQIFGLMMAESAIITSCGVALGILFTPLAGLLLKPYLENYLGLILSFNTFNVNELSSSLLIIAIGTLMSFIPAWLAYKKSLSSTFSSL